jgi:hypothetical protein
MRRSRIKTTDALPAELARSTPRAVTLTGPGIAAVLAMAALFAGGILGGVLIQGSIVRDTERLRLLKSEGLTTEARIVSVERKEGDESKGEDSKTIVRYRYTVNGIEYNGRTSLKKRDRTRFLVGTTVPVRYLRSQPEAGWLDGYGPGAPPLWLVPAVPAGCLLAIVPIAILLRRQVRLVTEGRSTLARVIKRQKVAHGEHSDWRIQYEWTLLNGATHTGRSNNHKNPPAEGALIPVLYERENPGRNAPYPLPFVRAR